MRLPKTARDLQALRGAAYERAVRRLIDNAKAESDGYNPLGGESDDIPVISILPDGTRSLRDVGSFNIYEEPSGRVLAVLPSNYARGRYYPLAWTLIYSET